MKHTLVYIESGKQKFIFEGTLDECKTELSKVPNIEVAAGNVGGSVRGAAPDSGYVIVPSDVYAMFKNMMSK